MSKGDFTRWEGLIESGIKLFVSAVAGLSEDEQTIDFLQRVLATSKEFSIPNIAFDFGEEFSWAKPLLTNVSQDVPALMEGYLLTSQGAIYSSLSRDKDAVALYLRASQVMQKDNNEIKQSLDKIEQNSLSLFNALFVGLQSLPSVLLFQSRGKLPDNPEVLANEVTSYFDAALGSIRDNPSEAQILLEGIQAFITTASANLQVDVLTSLADKYVSLNQLENARSAYLRALKLNFLYENSLRDAQIRYGLSRIEFSLGNFSAAEQAIRPALQILENNPPTGQKPFKGQFSQTNFDYGYDAQDNALAWSMGFTSKGIFEAITSTHTIPVFGQTCMGIAEYFSCKQSYFEHYINSLWELEQQDRLGRYAELSFEASERYRSGTPELFRIFREQQVRLPDDSLQQGFKNYFLRLTKPKAELTGL